MVRRTRLHDEQYLACSGKQFIERGVTLRFAHFVENVRRRNEIVFPVGRKRGKIGAYEFRFRSSRLAEFTGKFEHGFFSLDKRGAAYPERFAHGKIRRSRTCSRVEHVLESSLVVFTHERRRGAYRAVSRGHSHGGISRRKRVVVDDAPPFRASRKISLAELARPFA